ncbi:hypothetical protein BH24ACT15_BH24ACT15_28790 [soil metagenome]
MTLGRVVVVPLARPATAAWLGRLAALIARPDDGTVVPISVITTASDEKAKEQARQAVTSAADAAQQYGAQVRPQVVQGQRVPTAVLDTVDEQGASLVLMGWQGESTSNNVFGELIDSVMGRSNVPLAVVRPAAAPFERVLVPVSDDHLAAGGERGISLATELAQRLSHNTQSSLVVVMARDGAGSAQTGQVPIELRDLAHATLRVDGSVAQAVAQVARPTDIVVTPVAPTADGLRNATTHLAWATPRSWQMVAIDVGPPTDVDVVSAVKDAGMLIEPTPDPETDSAHLVMVSVTVAEGAPDPWSRIETAVRMVGTVVHHRRERDDLGRPVNIGHVEVLAPTSAAALAAMMVELDDARWQIAPVELTYGLVAATS